MRTAVLVLSVGAIGGWVAGEVSAQESVQQILEKAVRAHGGEALLSRPAGRTKTKGVLYQGKSQIPFTKEVIYHLPDRIKEVQEVESQGRSASSVMLLVGDKMWIQVGGVTKEIPDKKVIDRMKEAARVRRVMRLAGLVNDPNEILTALGEVKVDGRPALEVKVSSLGFRDVRLFFDKETGLLAKIERSLADATAGREVLEEQYFGEYQDYEGLKLPKKVVVFVDGVKLAEAEAVTVKYLDRIDPAEFDKP